MTVVLKIGGKQLDVDLRSTSDLSLRVIDAAYGGEVNPRPTGEEDNVNTGIQVLCVDIPRGNHDISILFSPRWDGEGMPGV